MFRAAGGEVPSLVGGGFLFDDVTNTTASGPGPAGCGEGPPVVIERRHKRGTPAGKTSSRMGSPSGTAATRRCAGCGRATGAACAEVPRIYGASAARAGRPTVPQIRLLRPGQRKTFRATFRLRANVTADTVTNGASADAPPGPRRQRPCPKTPSSPRAATPVRKDSARIRWDCSPSLPVGVESPPRPRSMLR